MFITEYCHSPTVVVMLLLLEMNNLLDSRKDRQLLTQGTSNTLLFQFKDLRLLDLSIIVVLSICFKY